MINTNLGLLEEYKKSKDQKILEELVRKNSNLVYYWARKFTNYNEPLEDLVQEGYVGLIKAIENYDPEKGEFSTYASFFIRGEITHYLRDKVSKIKIPKSVKNLIFEIEKIIYDFLEEEKRFPNAKEISKKMNLKEEGVLELLRAREALYTLSLEDEDFEIDLSKLKSERLMSFQLPIEDRIILEQAISSLPEIQRKIIYYIFYYDLTQGEIAKNLKISQGQVSKLLKKALKKLKEILTKEIF
ncbi:MAG: sigma-70 family RNA polymerase sigma factor [Dictyoglomaceae bacterium]|nr:sigma-70 family RNA polymerase sigma factor [Dictyoglomaceae bacterium]